MNDELALALAALDESRYAELETASGVSRQVVLFATSFAGELHAKGYLQGRELPATIDIATIGRQLAAWVHAIDTHIVK